MLSSQRWKVRNLMTRRDAPTSCDPMSAVRITCHWARHGAGFAEMEGPEIALPGLEWFNVAAPLPIASLHGRVVILDFWTEGCINCIQIIPTLRRVEESFQTSRRDRRSLAEIRQREARRQRQGCDPTLRHSASDRARSGDEDLARIRRASVADARRRRGRWRTSQARSPASRTRIDFVDAIDRSGRELSESRHAEAGRTDLEPLTEPRAISCFQEAEARAGQREALVLADGGQIEIVLLDDSGKQLERYGSGEQASRTAQE